MTTTYLLSNQGVFLFCSTLSYSVAFYTGRSASEHHVRQAALPLLLGIVVLYFSGSLKVLPVRNTYVESGLVVNKELDTKSH